MRLLYVVRFKKNGKVKRFKTTASSPGEAAKHCRSGEIISAKKVRKAYN